MTLTTQSLNLLKIIVSSLSLIVVPVVLMHFTFGIESYTGLLKNIGLSISILILSASAFLMIVFKKENIQVQKPWLLPLSMVCCVAFIFSTMILNNI